MKRSDNLKKILKIILAVAVIIGVVLITIWMFPYVLRLRDEEFRALFEARIESLGILGAFAMLVLQILQIIIAVIPGEPIEIVMGVMYGTLGGLLLSLLGIAVGSAAVFFGVKRFGMRFVDSFTDSRGFAKLKFLHDPKKRDIFLFLLFFIPGTPKDLLTYFAPFTGISFGNFIVTVIIARIPSIVSSTYIGSSITDGNLLLSAGVFVLMGGVGLLGILAYNAIVARHNKN